jgi:catechol 2,3-dioxygenase-like lactoylglutathione lyase family enzyme
MNTNIYSVAVMVSNTKKATDWYTRMLGMEIKGEAEDHWVVVGPRGSSTGLHLCQAGGPTGNKLEPGNSGVLLIADDLDKTVRELKSKGVEFSQDITKEEWGPTRRSRIPTGTSSV